jgi:hypothetical protein
MDMKRVFPVLATAILLGGCSQSQLPPELKPDLREVARIRSDLAPQGAAEDQSAAAARAEPTGYATLRGRFTLEGEAPAPLQLSITKDAEICAPGGKSVYLEELKADPATKGIANVVIYADKVPPEWVHEGLKAPAEEQVQFDQKECVFLTHVVALQLSQKLLATNSDPVGHNVMVKDFNTLIPANGSATYAPNRADALPQKVSCSIHPWMSAWLIARPDPYFAVTKADGSFEIPDLPAGVDLTFRVWQEKFLSVNGTVKVNGSDVKWSKGKFVQKLEPDTDFELNVVLDAASL